MTGSLIARAALPGVALAAFVVMFAGRFSVARLVPDWSAAAPWLELRLWALLAGGALLVLARAQARARTTPGIPRKLWLAVGLVAALQLALAAHALWLRPQPGLPYRVWELASTVSGLALLAAGYFRWGGPMVRVFLGVGLAAAVALTAIIWMGRMLAPGMEEGFLLGTVFTQVRIQLFGGLAGLVLLWEKRASTGRSLAVLLVVALCFTAAYLSLSKAILIAGVGALGFLAATQAIWFERRRSVQVLGVIALSVPLFVALSGSMFASRLSEGLLGTGYALSTAKVMPPQPGELPVVSGAGVATIAQCLRNCGEGDPQGHLTVARLQFDAQRRLADVLACSAGHYACTLEPTRWERDIAETMLRHRVYLPDFSFRIRLLLEGLRGVAAAPWLGHGFGSYRAVAINLYTGARESYLYPHNIVAELLHAVGVVGLVLVAAVLFALAWLVLDARAALAPALPMLAYGLAVGLGALFGGDYQDFRLIWWALVLALLTCAPLAEAASGSQKVSP